MSALRGIIQASHELSLWLAYHNIATGGIELHIKVPDRERYYAIRHLITTECLKLPFAEASRNPDEIMQSYGIGWKLPFPDP